MVTKLASSVRTPLDGLVGVLNVIVSVGSGSVPVRVMALVTPFVVDTLWASAIGAVFPTVIDTVAGVLSCPLPSLTVKVKLSAPAKPGFGV